MVGAIRRQRRHGSATKTTHHPAGAAAPLAPRRWVKLARPW